MTVRIPIKEAKKKFIKRSFYCGVVAILVCWFMKLFGFDYFGLDLDNKFFNDMSIFFENNYWLKQIYFTFTLNLQLYFMICIVNKEYGKKVIIYLLKFLPLTILVRVLGTYLNKDFGNLSVLLEFIYTVLLLSKLKKRNILKAILLNVFIIVYQLISLNMRSIEIKNNTYSFIIEQILSIDYYILLYLHKEVALMDSGTWFFFGFTAWLYRIAGFIVGLFTLHPIKKSREWYEKGKAKEDARKAKKATK